MLLFDQIVNDFARGVIEGIRSNIKNKDATGFGPSNNTGDAANSLFYRWDGKRLVIGSTWKYITVLEDGRKPGKYAPPDEILKYVETKIKPTDIKPKSLAYLINRKLKEEGSIIYQRGGNSGILSDYLNGEYVAENLTVKFQEAVIREARNILFP